MRLKKNLFAIMGWHTMFADCVFIQNKCSLLQNFLTMRRKEESSEWQWETCLCRMDCGNTIVRRQRPVLLPTLWIRGLEMGEKDPAKHQATAIWERDGPQDCKGIWETRQCLKLMQVSPATSWYPSFCPTVTEIYWSKRKQNVGTIDLLPLQYLLLHP